MDELTNQLRFFAGLGITHLDLRTEGTVDPEMLTECGPAVPSSDSGRSDAAGSYEQLPKIREDLGDCRRCKLWTTRQNIVFGVGDAGADLMFVGEAPGADEDAQGIPFVGKAGRLLTRIIEAIGLKREQVYIANILKCRPPGNRDPQPDEVEQCEGFLFRQIASVHPLVIVALGRYAAQTLFATTTPISKLRGHFVDYRGSRLIATFHPSYLLRNPSAKREVWQDMQAVRDKLKQLGSRYY